MYKIENVQLCVPVSDAPDGKTVYPNLLDCDNALHRKGYKPNPKPHPPSPSPPQISNTVLYICLAIIAIFTLFFLFVFIPSSIRNLDECANRVNERYVPKPDWRWQP